MDAKNLAVRIARAPSGLPQRSDFVLVEEPMPVPAEGEVLFRAIYMSLDPSMRRKLPGPEGAPVPLGGTQQIGDLMIAGVPPPARGYMGGLVGQVVESRHADFVQGDLVQGGCWWQTFQSVPGHSLEKLAPGTSLSEALGLLGQHGFVAWCGMRNIGAARPGETVVVSAAGGAIGMIAGQLAKADGARVIGIASGDKVQYVVDELGFDACIDRHAEDVRVALDRLCPDGIDVYFDNVGGDVMLAAYDRMTDFGRIVICGMASEYNAVELPFGASLRPVLRKRLRIEGFVVYDHYEDQFADFQAEMRALIAAGKMKYRIEVIDGFEHAPDALARLLEGRNKGKMIVQLGSDPTD
ncbi:MAG: NADP-dependent oxidoreductase [Novosphingobium sp.]|nr:NADP-dependent oxidoreductase [Novosphingobium sp.]